MSHKSVDFYYDFGSPAAYLAWTQMPRICAERGATLVLKPFLLGAVFKATGNASPVMIPAKGRFMLKDFGRWAKRWGVPLQFHPKFPFNTLEPMRAAAGIQLREPARLDAFNKAIFEAIWVRGLDFSQPAVIAQVLVDAGFDPAAIQALAADDAVKAHLRATTDEAVARGAFGAPTFVVDGELYWGQDRLFMVEEALA